MNQISQKQIQVQTKSFLKEGYDKIIKDFSQVNHMLTNFYETFIAIAKPVPKEKESFKLICKTINELKEFCKEFFSTLNESVNNNNNNNNNDHVDKDISSTSVSEGGVSCSISKDHLILTPKLKGSYERINSEVVKIENITKEVFAVQNEIAERRKKRIKMLDIKLQNIYSEVKNVNFDTLMKNFDDVGFGRSATPAVIEKSSNILQQHNQMLNHADFDDCSEIRSVIAYDDAKESKSETIVKNYSVSPKKSAVMITFCI